MAPLILLYEIRQVFCCKIVFRNTVIGVEIGIRNIILLHISEIKSGQGKVLQFYRSVIVSCFNETFCRQCLIEWKIEIQGRFSDILSRVKKSQVFFGDYLFERCEFPTLKEHRRFRLEIVFRQEIKIPKQRYIE